ncbi:MAG: queuosine precursor transporter [Lachnospiraceae bacterium]|nr:queuosine precursor transporter [Lachnospiraceae bacterium]
MNELLLILSLPITYFMVLLCYRIFGKSGLFLWTVVATIAANIEVLIVVNAFGFEMTLGNILFASTFLVTDILSENHGKKEAQRAVYLGITTSVIFILISQSWLLYAPSDSDFASPAIRTIFSNTPRLMFASLAAYAVCQLFDVWLYHKWWDFTEKKFQNKRKFLWLRNNGSTLVSQLVNTVLFNVLAFAGIYSVGTLVSIIVSCYLIFIITSLVDTPFIYMARKIHDSGAKELL